MKMESQDLKRKYIGLLLGDNSEYWWLCSSGTLII
jgi:hypothetical protein